MIRVLHSLARPDGTTKYVNQITDGAPDGVEVRYFSWRTALRDEYDVLHLHWPELLLRARTRRKRIAKLLAMRVLLARIRHRRVPLVRTLHNVKPHEAGGAIERRLLQMIDARTALYIRLNPTTAAPTPAPLRTILHGHYRDRFAAHARSTAMPGRLLYFGLIRPYKGVDRLLELVPELPDGSTLRIVGSPSAELRPVVERAVAAADDRVSAVLEFVPDERLVAEVTAAELVVLPYRELHNSGALLVALSLDRPVLVPASPAALALQQEVGDEWVLLFSGALEPADLAEALERVRGSSGARPRLEGRDWARIGAAHEGAYRAVLDGAAA